MSEDTVKDMLTIVYEKLVANPVIAQQTLGTDGNQRIKYYDNPATADHDNLFIVITPLEPPVPITSGSDQELSLQFTFQINVEALDRKACKQAQHEIKKEMFKLGFGQLNDGIDEYFPETSRFVDARRYRGNTRLYDTDY
jgi:hypothetical protein